MALSLVAQGLLAGLLGDAEVSGVRVTTLTTALGAVYGVLIAVPLVLGDINRCVAGGAVEAGRCTPCCGWPC